MKAPAQLAIARILCGMTPKINTEAIRAGAAVVLLFFFLACHGTPGVVHQSVHLNAAGTQHNQHSTSHAGDTHEAPTAQAHGVSGSGVSANDISANYAAVLLVLAFGAALLLTAARAARRFSGSSVRRSLAPQVPRWRPPSAPTPVRLQVFRL